MANKRGNGSGSMPTGQTSRGFAGAPSRNPKNNASRRPEHIGMVPGDGGAALINDSDNDGSSDGFPSTNSRNTFSRGSSSSIPADATVNRGYTAVTGANVPNVSRDVSANRFNFAVDPGTPPQPGGDTTEAPVKPSFGVGTNGE